MGLKKVLKYRFVMNFIELRNYPDRTDLAEAISAILVRHAGIFYGAEALRRHDFTVQQVYSCNLAWEL